MKLRKTKNRRRIKRKTHKRQKGGNGLIVKYGDIAVSGQLFKKSDTVSQPSIEFSNTGKKYSLIMWDPDAPNPSFLHWLIINLENKNKIREKEVLNYFGPNPPSGIHHYYFGLFEQQNTIQINPLERSNFNLKMFIKDNNLKEVSNIFMIVSAIN
jgi:phosphatidylethanolamine-binding protein (PEBP) family uncharacterized protein